jgi:hypothetical protein
MALKYSLTRVVELREWDRLVSDTYGRPYSLQQQDGCVSRGVRHFTVPPDYIEDFDRTSIPEVVNHSEMGVSFEAWLTRDPDASIGKYEFETQMWWHRNFYPHLSKVVEDLHNKGVLEEGEYAINIDW